MRLHPGLHCEFLKGQASLVRAMDSYLPEVDHESLGQGHAATAGSSFADLEPTSASSSTGVVRRRLRSKQAPTPEGALQPRSLQPAFEDAADAFRGSFWKNFDKEEWVSLEPRKKYLVLYWKFRNWVSKRATVAPEQPLAPVHLDMTPDELIPYAHGGLRHLTREQKAVVYGRFCALSSAPEEITEMVKDLWGAVDGQRRGRWLHSKTALLTWNGDWGLVKVNDDANLTSVDEVVSHVRQDTSMMKTWQQFLDLVKDVADRWFCKVYACSFELCTQTWQDTRHVRVHGHAFLFRPDARIELRQLDIPKFLDSVPFKSPDPTSGANRGGTTWAACYYVLCPKVGSIFTAGSVEPFKDFPVSSQYIVNLVQAKKMTFKVAHSEMALCGRSFCRVSQDLKAWERAQRELVLQEKAVEEQKLHYQKNLRFKAFPMVQEWWSEATQPHQRRKRFLVIEGPSGVGKTEFIKGLAGPTATLEISADGMTSPYLLNFDPAHHRVIFWDECHPQMVVAHRKLFQSPASWITLGVSPTGRDAYTVWVNDAVMAIASNSWRAQVAGLEQASDRDWLHHNAVLLVVTEKMYIPEPVAGLPAALAIADREPELPLGEQ